MVYSSCCLITLLIFLHTRWFGNASGKHTLNADVVGWSNKMSTGDCVNDDLCLWKVCVSVCMCMPVSVCPGSYAVQMCHHMQHYSPKMNPAQIKGLNTSCPLSIALCQTYKGKTTQAWEFLSSVWNTPLLALQQNVVPHYPSCCLSLFLCSFSNFIIS
jgi:hypothetical protein